MFLVSIDSLKEKPVIGSTIEFAGKQMEIIEIMYRLSPYEEHSNKTTKIIGYTLTVREIKKPELVFDVVGTVAKCAENIERRSTFSRCSPGIGNRKTDL
jgi:hypothetical protein